MAEDTNNNIRYCKICGKPIGVGDFDGLCSECRENEGKPKEPAAQDTGEDDENIKADEDEEKRRQKQDRKKDNDDDDDDEEDDNKDNNKEDEDDHKKNDDKKDNGKKDDDHQEKNESQEGKNKSNTDNKSGDSNSGQTTQPNQQPNSNGTTSGGNATSGTPKGGSTPSGTTPGGTPTGGTPPPATAGGGAASTGGTAATTGGTAATTGGAAATTGSAAATTGGAAATTAGAAATTGGAAATTAGLPVTLTIVAIIVLICSIIGYATWFFAMPGMVIGKIGEAITNIWIEAGVFFNGKNAASIMITQKDVAEAAQYLSDMGYDLEGYGFLSHTDKSGNIESVTNATKLTARVKSGTVAQLIESVDFNEDDAGNLALEKFSTKTIEERKKEDPDGEYVYVYIRNYEEFINAMLNEPHDEYDADGNVVKAVYSSVDQIPDSLFKNRIIQVTDENGTIGFAKSKYLSMYLEADNTTYLVRNYNLNIGDRFQKLFGVTPKEDEGCGLIYFAKEEASGIKASDYIKGVGDYKFVNAEQSLSDVFGSDVTTILPLLILPPGADVAVATLSQTATFIDLVKVDRPDKIMRIYNGRDGWFKTSYYDYSLDGWVSRYGIPLQLSLTMHMSTLSPDFAFKFAQLATLNKQDDPTTEEDESSGTTVNMGLLEVPDNTVRAKLKLDLGEGEKYYYIEMDRAFHMHESSSSDYEDGYETIDEAEQAGKEDTSGKKSEKEAENDEKYPTIEEYLDAFEQNLKAKTNNGANKAVLGRLVFNLKVTNDTDNRGGIEAYVHMLDGSGAADNARIGEYSLEIFDNDINELRTELLGHGYAYKGTINGTDDLVFKMTNNPDDKTSQITNRVHEIIKTYYKLAPITDAVYFTTESGMVSINISGAGQTLKNGIQNGTLVENESDNEVYNITGLGDDQSIAIHEGNENGVIGGAGQYPTANESGCCCANINSYYYNADLESFWRIAFMGEYDLIQCETKWYEDIANFFRRYLPIRQYYRLIDAETNEPVTSLTVGKEYNDFIYLDSVNSYNPDEAEEGWFWRKTIPVQLLEAFDQNTDMDATNVQEVLDDMYEYNIGDEDGGFVKYVPVLLEVKNHWYRDLSFKNCYNWNTSERFQSNVHEYIPNDGTDPDVNSSGDSEGVKKASEAHYIYIEETSPGGIEQIKEPTRIGKAGERVKALLRENGNDILYYKYNGEGRSEEKSKIDFAESGIDAIAMLEEIEGEDSQYIIRDYKALMKSFDIYFEETKATEYKMKLFSKVIDGVSSKEQILPQGDDCVIKVSIEGTQKGAFAQGTNVKSPTAGKVTYRSDDSVCIEIDEGEGGEHTGYTILISGFKVDDTVMAGDIVSDGTRLGETKKQDIKLTLRDENGAIVKNQYDMTLENDFVVKTDEDGGNTYTKDEIRKAIHGYGYGENTPLGSEDVINALYNIQEKYNVDPIFAAAVTISESSGGTADTPLVTVAHNWVSIKGSGFSYIGAEWNYYDSYADAIEGSNGFGALIAENGPYFQAGKIKVSQIGPTYCDWQWAVTTSKYMQGMLDAMNEN